MSFCAVLEHVCHNRSLGRLEVKVVTLNSSLSVDILHEVAEARLLAGKCGLPSGCCDRFNRIAAGDIAQEHSNYVAFFKRNTAYVANAAIVIKLDRCTLRYYLYVAFEFEYVIVAAIYLTAGLHLLCIGKHSIHFSISYSLFRHELAILERKPATIDRYLRIVCIGH